VPDAALLLCGEAGLVDGHGEQLVEQVARLLSAQLTHVQDLARLVLLVLFLLLSCIKGTVPRDFRLPALKGQCHEIVDFLFFPINQFPPSP